MLSGVASSARIARCPAAILPSSHIRRYRPTEGAKISTSLTMTKNTVSTSSRAERLRMPCSSLNAASPEPREDADEPARASREQLRRVEAAGGAFAGLSERRVGRDHRG